MKSYNLDKGGPKMGEVQSHIVMMIRQSHGSYKDFPFAPKREALKVFGGVMDIDEFRRCKEIPFIRMPDDIFIECGFNKYATKKSEPEDEGQLKIRREKPLKRNESALEKALRKKR